MNSEISTQPKGQPFPILEGKPPTLDTPEKLVLETVRHVERLAELSAKFPEQFKAVARQMPAWPVMRFKRDASNNHFWHVLYRLQLGEDYPIDTSSNARSHPSSIMGQYLTRCVERLHRFRWRMEWPDDSFHTRSPELKSLLELALRMRPLTKANSDEWSRRVLVPMIMLLDAGADEASCKEPALQAIWRQRGVKSPATFRSRLLTKVRQTLRGLAKPG